jgi:hypothetical protein
MKKDLKKLIAERERLTKKVAFEIYLIDQKMRKSENNGQQEKNQTSRRTERFPAITP